MRYIKRRPRFYRSRSRKPRLRVLLAVCFAAALVWAGFSEVCLMNLSETILQEAVREYLYSSINNSVNRELENCKSSFLEVEQNAEGQVNAAIANIEALNKVKAGLTGDLNGRLNGKVTISIPIGSFTDIALLNGRGPSVPVRLQLKTTADVKFTTDFTSAGVNQVCHRILMTVQAQAYSQSNRFQVASQVETATVLSETVIVGTVPNFATGILG